MDLKKMIADLFLEAKSSSGKLVLLASTMEPVVTGLLSLLENEYYHHSGVIVRHVGTGSGQAMALAIMGRVDLVLTHAPEMEDAFIKAGYGFQRFPVMCNDFILVGANSNPAGLETQYESAKDALLKIYEKGTNFISRGDRSGTHFRELRLWEWAGLEPFGRQWYHCMPKLNGSGDVMRLAVELDGYTLVDRASYLSSSWSRCLRIFVKEDALLTSIFSAIPVNAKKVSTNQYEAELFAEWLTGQGAARIIKDFGKDCYGSPLFTTCYSPY